MRFLILFTFLAFLGLSPDHVFAMCADVTLTSSLKPHPLKIGKRAVIPEALKPGAEIEFGFGKARVIRKRTLENTLILEIPRKGLLTPAWNSFDHEMFAKGKAKSPRVYEKVLLGHDGYFYASDNNHGLAVDSRKNIRIAVSLPLNTVYFHNYLEMRGEYLPSREEAQRYLASDQNYEQFLSVSEYERLFWPIVD